MVLQTCWEEEKITMSREIFWWCRHIFRATLLMPFSNNQKQDQKCFLTENKEKCSSKKSFAYNYQVSPLFPPALLPTLGSLMSQDA